MSRTARITEVAQREFTTVLRTPLLLALSAGFVLVVVAVAWLGGRAAYISLVLDLLTPLEVLVPVLAFAFGYRALLGDRESGELETIRTYPVGGGTYVTGVFLGRAVALLAVVFLSLFGAAVLVPLGGGDGSSVIASHATVDTPGLFLRYALLTAVFAVVALAVAILVSAGARSTRGGLALATGAVIALVIGLDSSLVAAVTGGFVAASDLATLLVVSPASAYRTLVLQTAIAPAGVNVPAGADAVFGALGLSVWFGGALALAAVLVWR